MMKGNQQRYIQYLSEFAKENKVHIWLGGSFLKGNATAYSDVDISVCCKAEQAKQLIYGYGDPVFLSRTSNPMGILIVIYEDGVSVDLEIVKSIEKTGVDFFHQEDIKVFDYKRDEDIYKEIVMRDDKPYQVSRLFHRSLIKYLSGKEDIGIFIANEIATFLEIADCIDQSNYMKEIRRFLDDFSKLYPLEKKYAKLLEEIIEYETLKQDIPELWKN